jgi:uncharacterized membrane protein HdeD (DUF308 family)
MDQPSFRRPPWPLIAGLLTLFLGLLLLIAAPTVPVTIAGAAVVIGALLELAVGLAFTGNRGAGMAHVFSGAVALGFALYLAGTALFFSDAVGPSAMAMLLGLVCLCNAIFRALDLAIDRPRAALSEVVDMLFTFVLGVALLTLWRSATPTLVATAAGLELVAGGVAMAGSALQRWLHGDQTPYDGRLDRLERVMIERQDRSRP